MAKLTFQNADLVTMLGYNPKAKKLILVKDDGIYIMGNVPKPIPPKNLHVAYAKGYNPFKGDVWERSLAAVGGDDFGEDIDLTPDLRKAILDGEDIIIGITKNHFSISTTITPKEANANEVKMIPNEGPVTKNTWVFVQYKVGTKAKKRGFRLDTRHTYEAFRRQMLKDHGIYIAWEVTESEYRTYFTEPKK